MAVDRELCRYGIWWHWKELYRYDFGGGGQRVVQVRNLAAVDRAVQVWNLVAVNRVVQLRSLVTVERELYSYGVWWQWTELFR